MMTNENISEDELVDKLSSIGDEEERAKEAEEWIEHKTWVCRKCGLLRDNVHMHMHKQPLPREVLKSLGVNERGEKDAILEEKE